MKRPIKSDSRYTIAQEFCGHDKPRFVLRWCGEFIMSTPHYSAAVVRAAGHKAIVIEEKTSK